MTLLRISSAQLSPSNGGHIEMQWRYLASGGVWNILTTGVEVLATGQLVPGVNLNYDETINSSIEIRARWLDATNTCDWTSITYNSAAPTTTTTTTTQLPRFAITAQLSFSVLNVCTATAKTYYQSGNGGNLTSGRKLFYDAAGTQPVAENYATDSTKKMYGLASAVLSNQVGTCP